MLHPIFLSVLMHAVFTYASKQLLFPVFFHPHGHRDGSLHDSCICTETAPPDHLGVKTHDRFGLSCFRRLPVIQRMQEPPSGQGAGYPIHLYHRQPGQHPPRLSVLVLVLELEPMSVLELEPVSE